MSVIYCKSGPLGGHHNAPVVLCENEFDTPELKEASCVLDFVDPVKKVFKVFSDLSPLSCNQTDLRENH